MIEAFNMYDHSGYPMINGAQPRLLTNAYPSLGCLCNLSAQSWRGLWCTCAHFACCLGAADIVDGMWQSFAGCNILSWTALLSISKGFSNHCGCSLEAENALAYRLSGDMCTMQQKGNLLFSVAKQFDVRTSTYCRRNQRLHVTLETPQRDVVCELVPICRTFFFLFM